MFKKIFLLLLTSHILGDFYIQTAKTAERKEKKFSWILLHSFIYFFTAAIISIPFASYKLFFITLLSAFSHMLIDSAKYWYIKKAKPIRKKAGNIFVIDQIAHFICLTALSYFSVKNSIPLKELPIISDFFHIADIPETSVLTWLLALLIIHKPANIFIQKLISGYKPPIHNDELKTDNNIGRIIGTSERTVMLMLISIHQYSAIGLVLTAKSIARYDRISKDEKFAEYYLLGTLISTGIVIVCAVTLF